MTRGAALFLELGVSAFCFAVACGGPSKLASLGETCFRATDCDFGLICSPDRTCTDDTSAIDIRPDAGATTGVGGGGVGGQADASASPPDGVGSGGASGAAGAVGAGGSGTATGGSNAAGGAATDDAAIDGSTN
jgi:hypothetical protein